MRLVVQEGSSTGGAWLLAKRASRVDDRFWQEVGVDPAAVEQVEEWRGLGFGCHGFQAGPVPAA